MSTPDQPECPVQHSGPQHQPPHDEAHNQFLVGQMWGIISSLPGRLDNIERIARDNTSAINTKLESQQREINGIKNKQYWFSGVTAAAGVAIGAIVGHLGIK